MKDLIEEAKRLFGDQTRPEHFTNYQHCRECAEHDETLRSYDLDSLSYEQLSPAWDPFCFITPEGFSYYFPALVRLALEGTGETYFIDQFLFHLEYDGPQNARFQAFSKEQRQFVARVLDYLLEHRAKEIDANFDANNLLRTMTVWSEPNNM